MKQYIGYIYETINIINKKKYIGSHIGQKDDTYLGSGIAISRAVKKYGQQNFKKRILELIYNYKNIFLREQYWLDKFNCSKSKIYYNISPTACGGNTIKHMNKTQIKKIQAKRANTLRSRSQKEKRLAVYKMKITQKNRTQAQKNIISRNRSNGNKQRWKNISRKERKKIISKANKTKQKRYGKGSKLYFILKKRMSNAQKKMESTNSKI